MSLNCPKCRIETMKLEVYEGIEVDRCPACKGIFLDRGELKGMIAKKMGHKADTLLFSAMSDQMDEVPAHCPKCNQDMSPVKGPGEVRIEQCPSCNGVFLDQGELATLQVYYS